MNVEHRWKLREWIPIEKLNFEKLSMNPSAIWLLEQNSDKIYWSNLSKNPSGMHLLLENRDRIERLDLFENPSAMFLIEKDIYNINWNLLSLNP